MVDGFPCKSLSSQTGIPKSFADGKSITGQGFRALLSYVDYASPMIVLCENVRVMLHTRHEFDGEKPILIQHAAFEKRGYHCHFEKVNSCEFGLRQSRQRVYSIYIKTNHMDEDVYLGRPLTSCCFLFFGKPVQFVKLEPNVSLERIIFYLQVAWCILQQIQMQPIAFAVVLSSQSFKCCSG